MRWMSSGFKRGGSSEKCSATAGNRARRVGSNKKTKGSVLGWVLCLARVGNNMMLTWCWLAPIKWLAEWLGVEDVGKDEDEKTYPF